jgi:DnaA family protein
MQQLILDLSRPPAPTLGNFAPGSNGEALAALHAWLSGTLEERCIYLWGPPGSGKSHLLRAAMQAQESEGHAAVYATASAIESLEQSIPLVRAIAVDDVQRLTDTAQGAVFRLFHRTPGHDVRLLAAGDAAPAGLALRDDVRTRLGAGLVFQLRLLSDADKGDALRSHALERGFDLAPELTDYLLRHVRRDLPSLMAVLDALDQHSLQTKRTITVPLLREVLQLARR